jgi:hypothetical protein
MLQLLKRLSRPSRPARARTSSPRTSKPMLETLEDRQVPSSTGVISSITAPNGLTYAFAVGSNAQVHVSQNSQWYNISYWTGASFRQVSAGVDTSGRPCCYAIQTGTGNLWEFGIYSVYGSTFGGTSSGWGAENLGGVCLQISATRNGECYAIGTDHSVYLNNSWGSWTQVMSFPGGGAVQISAGVDQWGQDKCYALVTYASIPGGAFVDELNHDGSGQWLTNQYGSYLRASQISAGIGNNTSGVDLYYLDSAEEVHFFNGSTDSALHMWGTQISAGLNLNGSEVCQVLDDWNSSLYTVSGYNNVQWDGSNIAQISAAQNGMVFVVALGNDQISAFDPNNMWWQEWSLASSQGYSSWGSWHYWGGISANPNS